MFWPRTEDRSIIHLNAANFAVAVERVVDSRLRDRPVVVAARSAGRAAVYDMSEEAYQSGVRKRMPLNRALKTCRDALVAHPHFDHYERAMKAFLKHVNPYSPLIEAGEVDGHIFADLTGTGRLFGHPADAAWRIRKAVKSDLGIDPIWSVAPNKLVARAAARLVKPSGEYIVEAGEEEEILKPLPVYLLPGLEREDVLCLREFNIYRVGEAALWTVEQLSAVFGKRGKSLFNSFRGIDPSPVMPARKKDKSIRRDHEFGEDANDRAVVEGALYGMVETIGEELRRKGLAARRASVLIDYSDGMRAVRQKSAAVGTAVDFKLFSLARQALELAWLRRVRIRHIRLVCGSLTEPPAQLELFPEEEQEKAPSEKIPMALDLIRSKFGADMIRVGRTLAAEGL